MSFNININPYTLIATTSASTAAISAWQASTPVDGPQPMPVSDLLGTIDYATMDPIKEGLDAPGGNSLDDIWGTVGGMFGGPAGGDGFGLGGVQGPFGGGAIGGMPSWEDELGADPNFGGGNNDPLNQPGHRGNGGGITLSGSNGSSEASISTGMDENYKAHTYVANSKPGETVIIHSADGSSYLVASGNSMEVFDGDHVSVSSKTDHNGYDVVANGAHGEVAFTGIAVATTQDGKFVSATLKTVNPTYSEGEGEGGGGVDGGNDAPDLTPLLSDDPMAFAQQHLFGITINPNQTPGLDDETGGYNTASREDLLKLAGGNWHVDEPGDRPGAGGIDGGNEGTLNLPPVYVPDADGFHYMGAEVFGMSSASSDSSDGTAVVMALTDTDIGSSVSWSDFDFYSH
jgi:hypothetical protein